MSDTLEMVLRELATFNGEPGTCWDAESNLDRLNRVRNLIYQRGDYEGTMEWGCAKIVDDSCIYLPEHLLAPRIARISSCPVLVYGQNYFAIPATSVSECCSSSPDTSRAVQMTGQRRPICATPSGPYQIKVVACDEETEELSFRGIDADGLPFELDIVPKNGEGDFIGDRIFDITEVFKKQTKGPILVWYLDSGGEEGLLAEYSARSINPRFTQMRILNFTKGSRKVDLVILAKKNFKRYTKADVDNDDLIDIQSTHALSFGYQALNAQLANRDSEYATKIQLMEEQLDQVDQDIGSQQGSYRTNISYSKSLSPAFDNGATF